MPVLFFFKGVLVGIIISAPIGPVGALCIQRSISYGKLSGVASGLGAAMGDTVFAVVAVFGLTFIYDVLVKYEVWFRVAAGVILLFFGLSVYLSKPIEFAGANKDVNHFGAFSSALLLTLSNPLVILSITALYSIMGILESAVSHYYSAVLLILGVLTGAILAWFVICHFTSGLGKHIGGRGISLVNRISVKLILACCAYAFLSILFIYP